MRYEHNPAAELTKSDANDAVNILLKTHRLSHPVEQYFIRRISGYFRFSCTSEGAGDGNMPIEVTLTANRPS